MLISYGRLVYIYGSTVNTVTVHNYQLLSNQHYNAMATVHSLYMHIHAIFYVTDIPYLIQYNAWTKIFSVLKNTRFSGKGHPSLHNNYHINVVKIRKMLISCVKLDHALY